MIKTNVYWNLNSLELYQSRSPVMLLPISWRKWRYRKAASTCVGEERRTFDKLEERPEASIFFRRMKKHCVLSSESDRWINVAISSTLPFLLFMKITLPLLSHAVYITSSIERKKNCSLVHIGKMLSDIDKCHV